MNRTLIITLALTLLLCAACSRNEAQDPAPEIVSEIPEMQLDEASGLAEREQALAQREVAVEQRERQLDRVPPARVEEPIEAEPPVEPAQPIATVPEPAVRTVALRLPTATPIEIEFQDSLSSEASLVGDRFRASVVRDVLQDGIVAIPAGSEVLGTVSSVVGQKKIGGQQRLALSFDRVELPSGQSIGIQASLEVEGRSQKKKDAATIGGSAAGGAVLGRVLSRKGKSAAIGAVLGAAIGTAVASKNAGDPVVIEPGSFAELLLEIPIHVTVDLSSVETDDYAWKFLGEETIKIAGKSHGVYKLEARPNYKDTGYAKLIIYVNKKYWRAEQTVFHDKAGRKLKTLTLSKWHHIHKRFWRPEHLQMENHQTHKKTEILSSALFLDMSRYKKKDGSARANLKDSQFTRRALEN